MLTILKTEIQDLYQKADAAVARFRSESGLSCPQGCLQCCHSHKVEATVLEMLPLAFHLFETGEAELLIKRLESHTKQPVCCLFRPDLAAASGGGCSHYGHRPLLCRLFGFAGSLDKLGNPRLAFCRVMKEADISFTPEKSAASLPLFHSFGLAVTAMHEGLGRCRLPINEALQQALIKVGLVHSLLAAAAADDARPATGETPFSRPFFPGRKAA